MIRAGAALALALACAACGTDRPGGERSPAGREHLTVGAITAATVPAGGAVEVAIPVNVADGFHVQANPAASEFLVPLELRLRPLPGVAPGAPRYPAAEPYRLQGSDDPLLTYAGTITIALPLAVDPGVRAGRVALRGTVRYQACDATRCYVPSEVPLEIPLVIVDGAGLTPTSSP